MSTATQPLFLGSNQRVFVPSLGAAQIVILLISLRWVAGIAENIGVLMLSELTAVIMLVTLGVILIATMRIATPSALFITGIITWIFCGVLSFVANDVSSPKDSFALLFLLLLYGLIANALTAFLRQDRLLPSINRFFLAFVVLGALLAIFQVLTGHGFVEAGRFQQHRAIGSDVHPVSFAIQIVAALVALECIRAKRNQRLSIAYLIVVFLGITALYLTFARTAWLMLGLIICYTVFRRSSLKLRLLFIGLMVPIAGIVLLGSDRFSDLASLPFFWSNFSMDNIVFDHRYIDNSISWRIVNWGYGFNQAMEQPLLGFGPGQSAASSYFNLEMHNILLETFFEGGLIGLTAFLIVLAGLFKMHWCLPQQTRSDRYAKTLANSFGMALFLAVVFSTSFVDQLMSFTLYMLVLTVAGIPTRASKSLRE